MSLAMRSFFVAGAIFTGLWIGFAICILNNECYAGLQRLLAAW